MPNSITALAAVRRSTMVATTAEAARRTVLAHHRDRGRLQDEHADQGQVDEVSGVRQEADRQRGQDRAARTAHARRHRVGERAEVTVHVEHGRADRAQGRTGGHALDDPGGVQSR
jgi:hypothetical protein